MRNKIMKKMFKKISNSKLLKGGERRPQILKLYQFFFKVHHYGYE